MIKRSLGFPPSHPAPAVWPNQDAEPGGQRNPPHLLRTKRILLHVEGAVVSPHRVDAGVSRQAATIKIRLERCRMIGR